MTATDHACIARALKIIDERAGALGMTPGFNGGDFGGLIVGTDLNLGELERIALGLTLDFLPTLASADSEDDLISYLAGFWRQACITGAVAVAEGPNR